MAETAFSLLDTGQSGWSIVLIFSKTITISVGKHCIPERNASSLAGLQAQNLAELAIDAREKAEKGRQRASEAERDVEAALIVKQQLEADIEQLRHISSEPSTSNAIGTA